MTKRLLKSEISKAGRKTIVTKDVLAKLEYAFIIGSTDEQASIYADISTDTLYYYQKKNPDFASKKLRLKQQPILKAKDTIYKNLDKSEIAKWFLERKAKNEFSLRTELTGKDGGAIEVSTELTLLTKRLQDSDND